MNSNTSLIPFLPPNSAPMVIHFINLLKIRLKITKERKSKFGDYRYPNSKYPYHRITVNGNLNPYSFLITTLHEIAHAMVYDQYKNRVQPHGIEWKKNFRTLLIKSIEQQHFPDSIAQPLALYAQNPKASTASDQRLMLALNQYNTNPSTLLVDLKEGEAFKLGKKIFIKGPKQRTRFLCIEQMSNQRYLVNGIAEITRINKNLN